MPSLCRGLCWGTQRHTPVGALYVCTFQVFSAHLVLPFRLPLAASPTALRSPRHARVVLSHAAYLCCSTRLYRMRSSAPGLAPTCCSCCSFGLARCRQSRQSGQSLSCCCASSGRPAVQKAGQRRAQKLNCRKCALLGSREQGRARVFILSRHALSVPSLLRCES